MAQGGELILYRTEDGATRLVVRFEDGNVWLTQAAISELFQTTPQNITMHLAAIYAEGELEEQATCKEYLQVPQEGVNPEAVLHRRHARPIASRECDQVLPAHAGRR